MFDGDRHEKMTIHALVVGPDAQIHAVPDSGVPHGGRHVLRHGDVFLGARPGLQLLNGHRIQADAGPQQKGVVVAEAHVHTVHGRICKQGSILCQRIGAKRPLERPQAKFHRPDIHGPGGEHAQSGVGIDEAVGDLPDRAIAADRKDRIELLRGGFACHAGGVTAAERLCEFDAPAGITQRTYHARNEGLDRCTTGGRIVEQQRSAHEEIITGRTILIPNALRAWRFRSSAACSKSRDAEHALMAQVD